MISQQQQSRTTQRQERTANGPGLWNGALYLVRRELRRTWRSYIWALIIAPLMGVAAAFVLGASPEQGAGSDGQTHRVVLNVFFIILAILPRTSNWHSGEQGSPGWSMTRNSHLSFLRSLPLTVRQIVAARALVSVVSVLALIAIFFVPLYAISEPLRTELGAAGCVLFAVSWTGCALAFEAAGLFTEMGLFGWLGFWTYMVAIWFGAGFALGFIGPDESVVSAVTGLTQDYGALFALVALAMGCGALTLSWLATARRLRKKEAR